MVEHVNVSDCMDLAQLRLLAKYIDLNSKMLIQGHPKLRKFIESIERRIQILDKDKEEYAGNLALDTLHATLFGRQ